jgi:hypothetical protein
VHEPKRLADRQDVCVGERVECTCCLVVGELRKLGCVAELGAVSEDRDRPRERAGTLVEACTRTSTLRDTAAGAMLWTCASSI